MSASITRMFSPQTANTAGEPLEQPGGAQAYDGDTDTLHTRLVRWFEEAERASIDERELAERDRDYFLGTQWTQAERDALRKRGQPEITINKIRDKVELLCGLERRARTDPKAFPRTPTEEDRANAATDALRYIADDNDFPIIRSYVYENMLVEGKGGAELGLVDDGKGGADITVTHVPWERIWHDPHSRQPEFDDARYKGIVIWMDRDQLDELYPDAGDIVADSFAPTSHTYDDRPTHINWSDTRRERARICQCHWSEKGIWWRATYSRMGILAGPERSPFKDRRGRSACALVLQSAYIDRENRRFGAVRNQISLQDEINKRRSKALHLLSVHQAITEQGAVQDIDATRRELAKPDGLIIVNPGMRFDIQEGGDLATGQLELLKHATTEMQLSGPNAAMSGQDDRELSGRAILAQQAGGAAQNEPLADSLRFWSRRVYEMAWMAAREYWTAGRWVRVTDDLGSTKWTGINRHITLQDELAQMPEQRRAMVMQRMQPPLMPGDPRLQQVVRVENDITDLDVDITIEEGMDIPSIQAEQFQTLVQMAGVQPGLIPGDVLIAASGLRNKDALLKRMKEHQQQQAAMQAKQQPIIDAHAQATVAKLQGDAAAQFALAQERQHSTINTIANTHATYTDMQAPPDPPSAPGTNAMPAMPPEIQALHDHAALRATHAKAAVDEAKVNDLMHGAVKKIAETHMIHHTINNPPKPAAPQR
jgi:hypothetical protein